MKRKLCRCGCGQIATHLMTGTEFGKPIPPEQCCKTAGEYCGELAAQTGDQHTLMPLDMIESFAQEEQE